MNEDPREYLAKRSIIDPITGCWTWQLSLGSHGYGQTNYYGKPKAAHLFAYELYIGPRFKGMILDHTCHNGTGCLGGPKCLHRRCINPYHLEPVTFKENLRRGQKCGRKRKLYCPKGHPYSGKNLYVIPGKPSKRSCRICNRAKVQAYKKRKRQERRK